MPIAIWALSIGAFAICTSEFVIMGLLQEVAKDLNVSISQSGFLVTGYALGVVLGAPFLTPFLIGLKRKAVLIGLMLLFTVGNVACAIAPDYNTMLIARVFTALAQAAFFGLGAVVAIRLVKPEKQASAIAAMFLGATLANIIGAPFGTYIGQVIGWRNTYYIIAALGVISALSIAKLLPHIESEAPTNLRQEFAALIQPGMIRALLITILGFGGTFTVFTYISPILTDITGMSLDCVPTMLLLFGTGMAVGNPIGARLTNKSVVFGMRSTLLFLMVVLVALYFAMGSTVAMVVITFLFGVAMFATIPSLQTYVFSEAGKAPILASAFNIAAFNLGNAGGAWVGGEVIDAGLSLQMLPIIAAAVSALGLLLALSVRTKQKTLELVTS